MQPTPIRDFSGKKREVPFTADGDTFYGVERVATILLSNVVARVNAATTTEEKMEAVISFFDVTLIDASANLMRQRLSSKTNPIDIDQAMDIIAYLAEVYGGRPMQPSPNSSDGSATEETGTSSTAGAPNEVSIPATSPSLGS